MATYDVHVRFIGKHVVLIELFPLDVTTEALRAKIDRNRRVGQYVPNFRIEGYIPHQSFFQG